MSTPYMMKIIILKPECLEEFEGLHETQLEAGGTINPVGTSAQQLAHPPLEQAMVAQFISRLIGSKDKTGCPHKST